MSPSVPPGLDTCVALIDYDAASRDTLLGLKNRDQRHRVTALADALAARVPTVARLVVTWAPTGTRRRHQRGFDHAELLARAVARRRHLPARALLARRQGPPQVGLTVEQRWANPTFTCRRPGPGAVLVIDDVTTTGATLSAAARALRAAGAREVHGLVVARAHRSDAR
jgi:predicted amidophosphoribosyltransferase